MRELGTQYRWTKTQKNRSGPGRAVDYDAIAKRYLKNGVLSACSNCVLDCKIAQPVLPVRFYCANYISTKTPVLGETIVIKAGGKQPLKPLRKDAVSPTAKNASLPPSKK